MSHALGSHTLGHSFVSFQFSDVAPKKDLASIDKKSVEISEIFKKLKAKEEELWKLKYFTMQKYNLQKNALKETKILQDIITLYN